MLRRWCVLLITSLLAVAVVESAAARSPGPDGDLVALFPASLGDQALEVESFSGSEWVDRLEPGSRDHATVAQRAEALVASVDRSLEDLTIATALHEPSPGNVATISAVRVRGAHAYELVEPTIKLLAGRIGDPHLRTNVIAGRYIIRVRDASIPGTYPVTVHPSGDTVWFIEADRPLLDEIVGMLPPGGRVELPDAGIAVTFPADWEVRILRDRRSAPPDLAGPDVEIWDVAGAIAPDFEAGRCGVQQIRTSALTTAAVAEWFQRRGPGSPDREMSVMTVLLPAGEAVLIETVLLEVEESPSPGPGAALEDAVEPSFEPDASRPIRQSQPTYVLDTGDAITMLVCFGEEPPADLWLSIAKTFESLPDAA